ncbi:MAG: YceI family protein [Cytophagaceae bacterium]|nr:YceI family protein [Cytophagaceae bacterium]
MNKVNLLVILLMVLGLNAYAQASLKPIPDKSTVTFKIKNSGINVEGKIGGLNGNIQWNAGNASLSKIELQASSSSIQTGVNARDNHLKKEDYFDVVKFPVLDFKSTGISAQGKEYSVQGILTIKGKSKPIAVVVRTTEYTNTTLFEGNFEINRLDFGIGSSSWILSDLVKINFSILASK